MSTARAITFWLIFLPLPTFSLLGMDKQNLSLWQRFTNKFYYIQPSEFSSVDSCQIKGSRYSQQDFLINKKIKNIHCIGIADGHGSPSTAYSTTRENNQEWIDSTGKKYAILTRMAPTKYNSAGEPIVDAGATAAHYIAETLPTLLAQNLPANKFKLFLNSFILKSPSIIAQRSLKAANAGLRACIDDVYYKLLTDEERGITSYPGTTVALAVLYNNKLYCIHCGDTRIVALDKDKKTIYASSDHKPDRPTERKRIENAGGEVKERKDGEGNIIGYKVGSLAISRTLGDYTARHVIDDAEVKVIPASAVDSVIIASDGLWDNFDDNDKKEKKSSNTSLQNFLAHHTIKPGFSKKLIKEACKIEAIFNPQLKGLSDYKDLQEKVHDNISVITGKI